VREAHPLVYPRERTRTDDGEPGDLATVASVIEVASWLITRHEPPRFAISRPQAIEKQLWDVRRTIGFEALDERDEWMVERLLAKTVGGRGPTPEGSAGRGAA
jgi:hypothetical protein